MCEASPDNVAEQEQQRQRLLQAARVTDTLMTNCCNARWGNRIRMRYVHGVEVA
jgi:hypothetical protein